jgi:hypothetical protein
MPVVPENLFQSLTGLALWEIEVLVIAGALQREDTVRGFVYAPLSRQDASDLLAGAYAAIRLCSSGVPNWVAVLANRPDIREALREVQPMERDLGDHIRTFVVTAVFETISAG